MPKFGLTPPGPPKARKPRPKRKPPVSLSDEQLLALLERAKQHRHRDYVMILITYWHGLRASETCALRESDFDVAAGTVRITRGKGSEGGQHDLQDFPDNPLLDERAVVRWWLANRGQFGVKGGAKRQPSAVSRQPSAKMRQSTEIVSFLPDPACDSRNWGIAPVVGEPVPERALSREPRRDVSRMEDPEPASLLDEKPAGGPDTLAGSQNVASGQGNRSAIDPGAASAKSQEPRANSRLFPVGRKHFWRLVHNYALAAGIPRRKCKTHMLKHTIAKHLVRAGHPLHEIQEWMGWSTIETMNWYTRADEEELGHRIGDTIRAKAGLRQVQQGSLFSS
jgi:hypothetical protein